MSLIGYLGYLFRQIVGFAVATRRPGVLVLVLVVAAALAVGLAVEVAAPVAIYPFI